MPFKYSKGDMTMARIKKSLTLDIEPVLDWPHFTVKKVSYKGCKLSSLGTGMEYTLTGEKAAVVEMIEGKLMRKGEAWRNVFASSELKPTGLLSLAALHRDLSAKAVCEWVAQHGLLGFRFDNDSSQYLTSSKKRIGLFPNMDGVMCYTSEPLDLIRDAAKRAANVCQLWEALKQSYATGQVGGSDKPIRALVTIKETLENSSYVGPYDNSDGFTPKNLQEFKERSTKFDPTKLVFGVQVNDELRSRHLIPAKAREWRVLAHRLLAEYIGDHIFGEVEVGLSLQAHNKDEEQQDRNAELAPDLILKPLWRIQSALAAYYCELLMVMRHFRTCKTCGKDISHQRDTSKYCGERSTCRSTDFHRQRAAKKKSRTDHQGKD